MKIAIQGHPIRGKEVIQILESLGGKTNGLLTGNGGGLYYYIDTDDNNGIRCHDIDYVNSYKKYTLEEFEKEFPFKIGDKITDGYEEYLIIDMDLSAHELNYKIRTSLGNVFWVRTRDLIAHLYKQVKEMKEERNITLSLEKAKEWYKKGGELKEIALQAFNEKELNQLPRSWEEFVESTKFTFNGSLEFINGLGQCNNGCLPNKSIGESSKIWNKHVALFQLEQLRNCWWNGWEPEWNDDQQTKYCIVHSKEFKIHILYETKRFLSFPTIEMAKEFLECFKDLIEKAGDLI